MAHERSDQEYSRIPTLKDLILVCKLLNDVGAKYVVIGGFAMMHHGMNRTTEDIDLLVDDSEENIKRIKRGLSSLPDNAIRDLHLSDIKEYTVVRVADEVLIDLMGKASGISFQEIERDIEHKVMEGVRLPFLKAPALLKTKQTLRADDVADRFYLEQLLRDKESQH